MPIGNLPGEAGDRPFGSGFRGNDRRLRKWMEWEAKVRKLILPRK
jgi:hypothetical protein